MSLVADVTMHGVDPAMKSDTLRMEFSDMQTLFNGLNITLEQNVPLGPRTWYGVGGNAEYLVHPSSIQQLAAITQQAYQAQIPLYVLGSGANLLVSDAGVKGIVVVLDDPAFKQLSIEGNRVRVGAGYDLAKLVLDTARAGLSGLECLAGIPATVGGAIRMNAGGAYGDIGKSVYRIQAMDVRGQVYYRDRDDLVFSYRKSNIVAKFILEAEFELSPDSPDDLSKRVKEIFLYKKNSQPLADHSAGCAFKNPPSEVGATAGQLIDRAGLKGFGIGGARVSEQHANFIVATKGQTTASDILAVMKKVQETVYEKFGVELEREVVVWE
jgi:UDP-N-acetylmuramate dehydrogenase